jgi:hypothetical protein
LEEKELLLIWLPLLMENSWPKSKNSTILKLKSYLWISLKFMNESNFFFFLKEKKKENDFFSWGFSFCQPLWHFKLMFFFSEKKTMNGKNS